MNTHFPSLLAITALVAGALSSSAQANTPPGRYTTATLTVYDTRTKLTWQRTVPSVTYSSTAAKDYCATAGTFLGGTGWRLPTVKELLSIVDYSQPSAPIDSTAFPGTPANYFWSSTTVVGSSISAWTVSFGILGNAQPQGGSQLFNVRCVR